MDHGGGARKFCACVLSRWRWSTRSWLRCVLSATHTSICMTPQCTFFCVHFLAGISIVRATRNANNNLQLISVSRFLSAESDLSVGAHIKAEISLLGLDALNDKVRCCQTVSLHSPFDLRCTHLLWPWSAVHTSVTPKGLECTHLRYTMVSSAHTCVAFGLKCTHLRHMWSQVHTPASHKGLKCTHL